MEATRRRWRLIALVLTILSVTSSTALGVRIISYNVLNYSGVGREAAFQSVFFDNPDCGTDGCGEEVALRPDLIVLQEVMSSTAAEAVRDDLLNADPDGPGDYALATFTSALDTAVVYRDSIFEHLAHTTISDGTHTINRWHLKLVGYVSEAASIYVYGVHAPAGTDGAAQQARLEQALLIRQDASSLPAGSRFLVAGDLQLRADTETSYFAYTGEIAGLEDGRTTDPLNPAPDPADPVVWHGDGQIAEVHTESTREYEGIPCPPDCGMDDRYDFQLLSAALYTSVGGDPVDFAYVPEPETPEDPPTYLAYRAYGNDGDHFQQDIATDGINAAVGPTIAGNLREASDHLPVLAEYQVPARIRVQSVGPPDPPNPFPEVVLDFGDVVLDLGGSADLTVETFDQLALFGYIESLSYSFGEFDASFASPPECTPGDECTHVPGDPPNSHGISLTAAGTVTLATAFGLGNQFNVPVGMRIDSNDLDHHDPPVPVRFTGRIVARVLTVESTPDDGVSVQASPPDFEGKETVLTPDTYSYGHEDAVALTALDPTDAAGRSFLRWDVGVTAQCTPGTEAPSTIPVTMDDSKTATVVYGHVLTITSTAPYATPITVTDNVPADDDPYDGACQTNDGTTLFTRRYDPGTTVTLTAPDPHPDDPNFAFVHWEVDTQVETNDSSVEVEMTNADRTAVAVYALTLTVEATVDAVWIEVADDDPPFHKDAAGQDNPGATPFIRFYDPDTTVTLEAPDTHAGQNFRRWDIDGNPVFPTSFSTVVFVDEPKTATVVYGIDGDFDGDGDVDLDDHVSFFDCLAGPGATPDPTPPFTTDDCLRAFDFDDDSDVDIGDFGGFQTAFTG